VIDNLYPFKQTVPGLSAAMVVMTGAWATKGGVLAPLCGPGALGPTRGPEAVA